MHRNRKDDVGYYDKQTKSTSQLVLRHRDHLYITPLRLIVFRFFTVHLTAFPTERIIRLILSAQIFDILRDIELSSQRVVISVLVVRYG